MRRDGFTLTEVMFTVVILGIMATAVVLPQMQTLEAGKWRASRDVLEAIYAGERVYQTLNKQYCTPNPKSPPPDCTWDEVYVDDPNAVKTIEGVTFTVEEIGGGAGFTATATRDNGPCKNKILTIDNAKTETGDWPRNGKC